MLELLILLLLLILSYILSTFLELLLESDKLFVAEFGDVESHWYILEGIYVLGLVVTFQIHEERFLIR